MCEPCPSRTHGAWYLACSACQPASLTCTGDLSNTLGWWLLVSFWGSEEHHRHCVTCAKNNFPFVLGTAAEIVRELFVILPWASSSRQLTKHWSDWQWRRRYGVCCWLRMQPTLNTTFSPKAYRCLKQAQRRWTEDTQLPSSTQTTPNACQLQVYSCWLHIAAGWVCDVIYSLIRVSSPWPALLAMDHDHDIPGLIGWPEQPWPVTSQDTLSFISSNLRWCHWQVGRSSKPLRPTVWFKTDCKSLQTVFHEKDKPSTLPQPILCMTLFKSKNY